MDTKVGKIEKKYINKNFAQASVLDGNKEIWIDGRYTREEAVSKMNWELDGDNVVPVKKDDLYRSFALLSRYDHEWREFYDEYEKESYYLNIEYKHPKAIPVWMAVLKIKDKTKNFYGYSLN